MEEKLLELLKSILQRLEQLEDKLHKQVCSDESDKNKVIEELNGVLEHHKQQSIKIFNTKHSIEQKSLDNQVHVCKIIDSTLTKIQEDFNSTVQGENLKYLNDNFQLVSAQFKEDYKKVEADLLAIERRMKKVRNPYSIFLFSIALIILAFGLVGFLAIQLSDTTSKLKQLEAYNLRQYELGGINNYFKENPDKYKLYKKWEDREKQQNRKNN